MTLDDFGALIAALTIFGMILIPGLCCFGAVILGSIAIIKSNRGTKSKSTAVSEYELADDDDDDDDDYDYTGFDHIDEMREWEDKVGYYDDNDDDDDDDEKSSFWYDFFHTP